MDPLSGAASIIAVISLALQLAQSAIIVKQYLQTIRHAPAVVIRLQGTLGQLHSTAETIRALLESRSKSHLQDSQLSNHIYVALDACQSKLGLIINIFPIAARVNNGQNGLTRSWAQLRLAGRMGQISEFERQLELAMSFLQLSISLHSMDSNLAIRVRVESIAQQLSSTQVTTPPSFYHVRPHVIQQATSYASSRAPTPTGASESSVYIVWSSGWGLDIQLYKVNGTNRKQALVVRANIGSACMLTLQLSRPFWGAFCSLPITMSVRCLIPNDAAILVACRTGDAAQVKQLLGSGAANPNDVTPDNETALSTAIRNGSDQVVQLLIGKGADPNLPCGQFQISPLQIGIALGYPHIVRTLTQAGADLTYSSPLGWSLLHYVFERGRSSTNAEYFLMLGDSILFDDVKDSKGWTALHRCSAYGTAEGVRYLRYLGASLCPSRYTTVQGWSPVHVAAFMNNLSTLEALVSFQTSGALVEGVSIDAKYCLNSVDIHGWTPLHLAVHRGATDTMRWLLLNGADPHRTTYSTASWFPVGHEGESLSVTHLAEMSGSACLGILIDTLQQLGHEVTTEGGDVYWDCEE
ncbi:hypothetical protein PG995_015418 [Apiospora arundinis]|uniref:Ankyrin repeat-containing domain protein n=1 Tax=Apiospora arundinis TaxID=335852 RepID=A0ABR2IF98_9PEZI